MSNVMRLQNPAPADVEKRTAICAHAINALKKFTESLAYHQRYSIGSADAPGEVFSADELLQDAQAAMMFLDADTARVVERFLDATALVDQTLYPGAEETFRRSDMRRQFATALVIALVGYP